MPELFNDIYTTMDVFNRQIETVDDMSVEDRRLVASVLAAAWAEFESTFGDEAAFKAASAEQRTQHRLGLLRRVEALNAEGREVEACGVKLLALYLRGLSQVRRACEMRMSRRLQRLLEADLRHQILTAQSGDQAGETVLA